MGNGGEGGIRTHGTRKGTPHFECGTFDHSATSPGAFRRHIYKQTYMACGLGGRAETSLSLARLQRPIHGKLAAICLKKPIFFPRLSGWAGRWRERIHPQLRRLCPTLREGWSYSLDRHRARWAGPAVPPVVGDSRAYVLGWVLGSFFPPRLVLRKRHAGGNVAAGA